MKRHVAPDASSGVARKARNNTVESGDGWRVGYEGARVASPLGADKGVRPYTNNGGLPPWRRDE